MGAWDGRSQWRNRLLLRVDLTPWQVLFWVKENGRKEVNDEAHAFDSDGSPRYGSDGGGDGHASIRQDYARATTVLYERRRQPTERAAAYVHG
jgi:hypothetical protein